MALLTSFAQFFHDNRATSFSILAALGFTVLAAYPLYVYMRYGWEIKKANVFNRFSDGAKLLYLKTYFKSSLDETGMEEAVREFDALYRHRYGRYKYGVPLTLFVLTTFAAMLLLCETSCSWTGLWISGSQTTLIQAGSGWPLVILPSVAAAGISGAYLWIVADMISKGRRLDLAPTDILLSALRLAMAAALAVPISQIFAGAVALPIAFAIGAFPLETVRILLRRYVSDKFGAKLEQSDKPADKVSNLNGVDLPTADKLREADISTIAQLAHTDPVQLCMRTGLNFDFLIDIASQALAATYLGGHLDRLRSCGLRGAIELNYLLDALSHPGKRKNYALASALLDVVAALLHEEPSERRIMARVEFLGACDQIANDPYTRLLVAFWQDGGSRENTWIIPDYTELVSARAID